MLCDDLKTRRPSLKTILCSTGSQWSCFRIGVMCELLGDRVTSLASSHILQTLQSKELCFVYTIHEGVAHVQL